MCEGHKGRFALIKGDEVASVWDTMNDAIQAGCERFGSEPIFVQEVQLYVKPLRSGYSCTQLPDGPANSPIATDWNFYRRIVGQLLAEGHEGKWLLIKNETVVGIWDTEAEADAVRLEQFLQQPVLLKQVLAQEPVLRIGFNRLCRG